MSRARHEAGYRGVPRTIPAVRRPSGDQVELSCGDQSAIVTEVGASLRSYSLAGEPVIWGFGEDEMCSGGRGQLLAPWPNRLGGGRYRFDGRDLQLPIDDHANGCAIHGLLRWRPWQLEQRDGASASWRVVLDPQPGYPFQLELLARYELGDEGLRLRVEACNIGSGALPFGLGFHPYLDPGPGGLGRAVLAVPAGRRLELDDHGLPTGAVAEAVGGRATAAPRLDGSTPLGEAPIDECLTSMRRDGDGRWHAQLVRPGGGAGAGHDAEGGAELTRGFDAVELWADDAFSYCQVYTGDTLSPPNRRRAVAVEPMTCPPGAFATGEGLVVLAPGERFSAELGLRPLR